MPARPLSTLAGDRPRKWRRRIVRTAAVALVLAVAGLYALPVMIRGPTDVVSQAPSANPSAAPTEAPAATIRVMTLNLAHGRAAGVHQAFEKRATIEANLDKVGEVLRRERPDLAAFQEADGPSVWSGKFNHVEYLARAAEYPHFFRGEHVRGLGLSYGTALVSRLPLAGAASHTFAASPPTPPKGFVAARVTWPGRPGLRLNVVSVHLDFFGKSVRKKQVAELAEHLARRAGPTIVLGDFNSEWSDRQGAVRLLAERLKLRAHQPAAAGMETFPTTGRRLDWILISPPLEFLEYRTLPDAVSDHRAVVAVLGIRDAAPEPPANNQ